MMLSRTNGRPARELRCGSRRQDSRASGTDARQPTSARAAVAAGVSAVVVAFHHPVASRRASSCARSRAQTRPPARGHRRRQRRRRRARRSSARSTRLRRARAPPVGEPRLRQRPATSPRATAHGRLAVVRQPRRGPRARLRSSGCSAAADAGHRTRRRADPAARRRASTPATTVSRQRAVVGGRYGEPREDGPPRDVAVASRARACSCAAPTSSGSAATTTATSSTTTTSTWRGARGWPAGACGSCPRATAVHDYEFEKGALQVVLARAQPALDRAVGLRRPTLAALAPVLLGPRLGSWPSRCGSGWWREKLRSWPTLWRERRELLAWRARVQRHAAGRRRGGPARHARHAGHAAALRAGTRLPPVALMDAYRRALLAAARRQPRPARSSMACRSSPRRPRRRARRNGARSRAP